MHRVEKAKEKMDSKPSDRSSNKHIEAAKDVFVFVHMLQMIEAQTEEITELRNFLDTVSEEEEPSQVSSFEQFSGSKKKYLN
jgi:hypothetical protein